MGQISSIRSLFGFVVLAVAVCLVASGGHAELGSEEILRKADEARGNLKGVEWDVSVVSEENGRISEMNFNVQARGFDVLATAMSPPKDKGNKILLVEGNMWFHKPGLSKPVPIAQRQKLMGLAAYGDIASTNYALDYTATFGEDESVNGELCYTFNLKAKNNKTTYDQIKYWVSKTRLVGIKADYFTVSGKQIKTASMEFNNNVTIEGQVRPFISKIYIKDVLLSNDQTVLTFNNTALKAIPDHVFNLNLLVK